MMSMLFVGCLNREAPYFQGARGRGIATFALNEATGVARPLAETDDLDNPDYLAVDPARNRLWAVSEVFGRKEGVVAAYAIDPASGRLAYLNMQPALGSITAHCALSEDRRHLVVCNYAMGRGGPDRSVAVFAPDAAGGLPPAIASAVHAGPLGPRLDRQERPHAHCAVEVGPGEWVVADLGLDRLLHYRLEPGGTLLPSGETGVGAGAGPRHLAADRDRGHLYVVNELASTVQSFTRDGRGGWRAVSLLPALPESAGDSHCADLHLSPDGRFLYASNRGHDSIVRYVVDPRTAELSNPDWTPSGGATPRSFCLTPSGGHLIVANQNSDQLTIFSRNAETGALTRLSEVGVGTPMCVKAALIG